MRELPEWVGSESATDGRSVLPGSFVEAKPGTDRSGWRVSCADGCPWRAVLLTARLELRPLRSEDREAFFDAVIPSRAHLAQFSPLHLPGESDQALFERQLALTQAGEQSGRAMRRIAVLPDGTIAGAFNFNVIARGIENVADLSAWVVGAQAGRGLGFEAMSAMIGHALRPLPTGLGMDSVRGFVQRENATCVRVCERLGMVRACAEATHLLTGGKWAMHDEWRVWADATA